MSDHRDRPPHIAADGEEIRFFDADQKWIASWHPADKPLPDGKRHGSAAACFTVDGHIVLIQEERGAWGFPGGHPEGDEDWLTTLEREVAEEACATVSEATLLGYVKAICIAGHDKGRTLVRSVWRAEVVLDEWAPQHEITGRKLVRPELALGNIDVPDGQIPIYRRWLLEALA